MSEKVIVVTGAFATHTTKLYNYYVCPTNWDFQDVDYLAVNYTNEIKYLGKIIQGPLLCHLSDDESFAGITQLDYSIKVDLNEFRCKLRKGDFQIVLLEPIIGGCNHLNLEYRRRGAFVEGHRYFENLAEFFQAHQRLND